MSDGFAAPRCGKPAAFPEITMSEIFLRQPRHHPALAIAHVSLRIPNALSS